MIEATLEVKERAARAAYEVNRALCAATGDNSQLPWDRAPDWQRSSCIDGVNFVLANPEAPDSASHDNWTRAKLADGWTYGPIKDAVAKTHPCLVPFEDLPPVQQAKNAIFRATVLSVVRQETYEPKA